MTTNQAHNYIKVELDKTSSLELPAFEPEEIDYWFDETALTFIRTRYSGQNVKGESFEQSQKRVDDLRTLVVESGNITPASIGTYENSQLFDLPDTGSVYLFSLREEATITLDGSTFRVGVTPITHDQTNIKLKDPYSQHNVRLGTAEPLRLFSGSQIELIGDGNYSIDSLRLSYIKEPLKMANITTIDRDDEFTDFTDIVMFEIVKMTANSMLENIESQRYQTHSAEVASME